METPDRYRTKQETINYFVSLAWGFETAGRGAQIDGDTIEAIRCMAKAEAYRMAAFEIEHNAAWLECGTTGPKTKN